VEEVIRSKALEWFTNELKIQQESLLTLNLSSSSQIFSGLHFSFSEKFPFKGEEQPIKLIKMNGGDVMYMITKSLHHIISTPEEAQNRNSLKIEEIKLFNLNAPQNMDCKRPIVLIVLPKHLNYQKLI